MRKSCLLRPSRPIDRQRRRRVGAGGRRPNPAWPRLTIPMPTSCTPDRATPPNPANARPSVPVARHVRGTGTADAINRQP